MIRRKGFTLIELLIVVAIIAILAAIAVPNFLEAQTRSKVSRVKSDLRTLATAIEAYTVDYNYPIPGAGEVTGSTTSHLGPLTIDGVTGNTGILNPGITTPVSYVTNFLYFDPFNAQQDRPDVGLYTYQTYTWRWPKAPGGARPDSAAIQFNEAANLDGGTFKDFYGAWRILSAGPDFHWGNDFDKPNICSPCNIGLPYDPTNGTVSLGSIIRSQARPDQPKFLVF